MNSSSHNLEAMPSQICIVCRVSGAVGPYMPIPPERQSQGGRLRRHRAHYHGTVLRSIGEKQWTVYWEEIEKASDHFANTLKFESKAPTNGLEGLDLESIYNDHYYPGPNGLDHALLGTSRTERRPPVIATPHIPPVPTNAPPIVTTTSTTTTTATPEGGGHQNVAGGTAHVLMPPAATTPATTSTTTPALSSNHDQEDQFEDDDGERYDPQSIVQDFLVDADAHHNHRHGQYITTKQRLIGEVVHVGNPRNGTLPWTVRGDVTKDEVLKDKEFNKVGIRMFDFKDMTETSQSVDRQTHKRINLLSLLIHLWPGNWQDQVKQLNQYIQSKNDKANRKTRHGRARTVRETTDHRKMDPTVVVLLPFSCSIHHNIVFAAVLGGGWLVVVLLFVGFFVVSNPSSCPIQLPMLLL